MKAVISYVTANGSAFTTPDDALSAEHDKAAEEINEIIKGATVKDYYVPHAYTVELVLAFVPMPKRERFGMHPESVKKSLAKVEQIRKTLAEYAEGLSSWLEIKEGAEE